MKKGHAKINTDTHYNGSGIIDRLIIV